MVVVAAGVGAGAVPREDAASGAERRERETQ